MVQALLREVNPKTQTRRIVNPQPPETADWAQGTPKLVKCGFNNGMGFAYYSGGAFKTFKCPYGVPSDHIWVKETFSRLHDGLLQHLDPDPDNGDPYNNGWSTAFRADGEPANWKHYGQHWKPSIFMPQKLSRIILKVISVRVERLLDISESDARSEGYPGGGNGGINVDCSPFVWYRKLWESINGKGSWSANPWVWRVEFKRIIP